MLLALQVYLTWGRPTQCIVLSQLLLGGTWIDRQAQIATLRPRRTLKGRDVTAEEFRAAVLPPS